MEKLSIKLKHDELKALCDWLERAIQLDDSPQDIVDKMSKILMVKFWRKLKEKTLVMQPRNYQIQLEPETAMAFFYYACNFHYDRTSFHGNIIDRLKNSFHQLTLAA